MRIFCDLDTCRQYQMGAIPWNIIIQYIEKLGLDEYLSNMIEQIIRTMDIMFLKILDKENNTKNKDK